MTPGEVKLLRFLKEFAVVYSREVLANVPTGEDPQPFMALQMKDGGVVLAGLHGFMLRGEREKAILFGEVFPAAIVQMEATMAAFASFSWVTNIPKHVRERMQDTLRARGQDPTDSAAIRGLLEEEGIVVQDPEPKGREEGCVVSGASRNAEAMVMAEVIREGVGPPLVNWRWEPVSEVEPYGTFIVPYPPKDDGKGLGGSVIEGMREGFDNPDDYRGYRTGTDWRSEL